MSTVKEKMTDEIEAPCSLRLEASISEPVVQETCLNTSETRSYP
jgi:hypothetical protein